jgi:hypothetical protein
MIALGDLPIGATVMIDDAKTTPSAGGRIAVAPGVHFVELDLQSGASAVAKVDIHRGDVERVALSPQRATSATRLVAIVGGGLTLTLAAAGAIFLLNADAKRRDIEDLAAKREPGTDLPATSYADIASEDSDRKTFQGLGAGLLIGAGATGIASVVLWLWPDGSHARRPSTSGALLPIVSVGAASIEPRVGLGSLGAVVRF